MVEKTMSKTRFHICRKPKGEHLGEKDAPFGELLGVSHNPQLYQVSGWYYGLETIARIE
jgi:hypothetical protein